MWLMLRMSGSARNRFSDWLWSIHFWRRAAASMMYAGSIVERRGVAVADLGRDALHLAELAVEVLDLLGDLAAPQARAP